LSRKQKGFQKVRRTCNRYEINLSAGHSEPESGMKNPDLTLLKERVGEGGEDRIIQGPKSKIQGKVHLYGSVFRM
jgi:hypothetical protein